MGWWQSFLDRRRSRTTASSPDRYDGRPLLVLLDNYVMSAVTTLAPEKEASLLSITQQVFGGGDDWRATLRATLQLGDDLDASLRAMWEASQASARASGEVLPAEEFARRVVDANFAQLLGDG